MPPAPFEPAKPTSEQPYTYALDCAATGIGYRRVVNNKHDITADLSFHIPALRQ